MTTPQSITTSLEVSKQLKVNGYQQKSLFCWIINDIPNVEKPHIKLQSETESWKRWKTLTDCGSIKYFSAPTASELMEMLPDSFTATKNSDRVGIWSDNFGKVKEDYTFFLKIWKTNELFWIKYDCDFYKSCPIFCDKNFCDCLAKMWLYLKSKNLIKI